MESWGRYPKVKQNVRRVTWPEFPQRGEFSGRGVGGEFLPVGNRRSYGDVCLASENSFALDMLGCDRVLFFDPVRGVIKAQAGVLLSEILKIIIPHNWFLPVSAGTQFITLGGAVANDIHGKNHQAHGTFGRYVRQLELGRSDGKEIGKWHICSPNQNPELFQATIGGLGLTGVISWVEINLRKIGSGAASGSPQVQSPSLLLSPLGLPSPQMEVRQKAFRGFDEYFALACANEDAGTHEDNQWPYSVAWVDFMVKKNEPFRGIFKKARFLEPTPSVPLHENVPLHAPTPSAPPNEPTPTAPTHALSQEKFLRLKHLFNSKPFNSKPLFGIPLGVPFDFPSWSLNPLSVKIFNELYFRCNVRKGESYIENYQSFFYPLDAVSHWNRIYGRHGFLQYQFVVPFQDGNIVLDEIFKKIISSQRGSFLCVLKNFGSLSSPGMLSFPKEGVTLALDFQNKGPQSTDPKNTDKSLHDLFKTLDKIVVSAGGRIYPAKDACMSPQTFRAGYSRLDEFLKHKDPQISSLFFNRVMHVDNRYG